MRIDILTCLPQLLESPFAHSIIRRAIDRHIVALHIHNLRDYTTNKHKKVDDYPYGGQAGMVLSIEPIARCLEHLKKEHTYQEIIYMTPDGEQLNQNLVNQLSLHTNLMVICGHYKGIDERVREHLITRSISIGDYVLSGGELAAAILVDALVRVIPGALSDASAALGDSFQDGLLAPPVYTRPYNFQGWTVPEVLLSGDAKAIQHWSEQMAFERTKTLRPDLYQQLGQHEN
jgi:tRNA (guanine37-N1)-methyltransferase